MNNCCLEIRSGLGGNTNQASVGGLLPASDVAGQRNRQAVTSSRFGAVAAAGRRAAPLFAWRPMAIARMAIHRVCNRRKSGDLMLAKERLRKHESAVEETPSSAAARRRTYARF